MSLNILEMLLLTHTMPLETTWLGILKALAVPGLANIIILNVKQRGVLLARIFIHNHALLIGQPYF